MKIAIVDDNNMDRAALTAHIKEFSHTQNYEIEITDYSNGENFLEDEDISLLDAVFLDIYIGATNGMNIARQLRKNGYTGVIIFCTTTANYALEGYSVKALGYIIKPYSYSRISEMLMDVVDRLGEQCSSIRVKDGRMWHRIELKEIIYVENCANYINIRTSNGSHTTRMAFWEIEQELSRHSGFVRCDRGVMINLFNVQDINGNLISMRNGDLVSISRSNVQSVKEQYVALIFGDMEKINHA